MTADPILAALTAPGPTVAAGRGREHASETAAAFLAVLAGLLDGGAPPRKMVTTPRSDDRHGVPLPLQAIGVTPAPSVETRAVAVEGPDVAVPPNPGRPLAARKATATGIEGAVIVPAAARELAVGTGAVERSSAPPADSSTRAPALARGEPIGIERVAQPPANAGGVAQQTTAPSDAIVRIGQLQLPSAGVTTDRAPADVAQSVRAAPDPPVQPPDAPAEPRDASGLRMGRPATPEASSPSRPSPPGPSPAARLGVEITRAAANRIDHMVVRMEPPELGRVRIDLSFGNDGQLSARIAVERVETLEILQRDAHTLERSLQDAGLRADGGGLSFSLRRGPGQGDRDGSRPAQIPADGREGTTAESEAGARGTPGLHLLDIRA